MRTQTKSILILPVLCAGLIGMTLEAGPANATTAPTTTPAPTAAATPGTTAGATPTLRSQDAAGDHAMGSSIQAHAAKTGVAAGMRTLAAPNAASPNATTTATGGPPPGKIQGMDVSAWQHDVDFRDAYSKGARFAYIKATEGTTYTSSEYTKQYFDSAQAGMVRGGYVYAQPRQASGKDTADFFFAHGGGWSADGKTLPPLLDIEYGSAAQGTCYGMTQSQMRAWISQFSRRVFGKIHRWPAIYTTTDWWTRCTGNATGFEGNPLFVALYPVNDFTRPGKLGASWKRYDFWQWAAAGTFPGDQDVFQGSPTDLKRMATRTD